MRWPEPTFVERALQLPPEIRACGLARGDIPTLIELLAAWYPSLAAAEDQTLLTSAIYETQAALVGEEQDVLARPLHVLLFKAQGEAAPVGYLAVEYEPINRSMLGRMSVVDPRFRGRGLGGALVEASVVIARAMGVQMIYGLVELDNKAQCAGLERAGHLLCGIAPDSDSKPLDAASTCHVPEAVYVNLLLPADELVWPKPAALRPSTAALMQLLFEHDDTRSAPPPLAMTPLPRLSASAAARCAARPPGTWPDIRWLADELGLPQGLTPRPLARADVPRLIAALPGLNPELEHDPDHHMLDPTFYAERVAFAGEDAVIANRPVYAWVIEREGEIVGFHHATFDVERSTFTAKLSTLASPRDPEVQTSLPRWIALVGPWLEVETLLCWTDLRELSGQLACERSGLRLFGFLPASDRTATAPGVVRHGFLAIYGVSLVPPERAYVPARATMTPRVATLADFVLGSPA
ncbi:GNAT family N-acetyltransferase [Enhygromyxa salina]|uniref:Acetyltransferase (GNAT) family protein n=1 Tax=Enhygromyxa salina TaxID=215803 RepID=A0A2S9YC64_9BACT|nr:GNAT family N-acetyltransferase [Enhygromyxa salina]PRQ02704.1 Acetyltransferase (GNAT) family protein [Enhygromyxa salina]